MEKYLTVHKNFCKFPFKIWLYRYRRNSAANTHRKLLLNKIFRIKMLLKFWSSKYEKYSDRRYHQNLMVWNKLRCFCGKAHGKLLNKKFGIKFWSSKNLTSLDGWSNRVVCCSPSKSLLVGDIWASWILISRRIFFKNFFSSIWKKSEESQKIAKFSVDIIKIWWYRTNALLLRQSSCKLINKKFEWCAHIRHMICTHQAHAKNEDFRNNYAWNSAKKLKFHQISKKKTCSGLCHIIVIKFWFQASAPIVTDSKWKNTTGRTEFSKQFYC